VFPCFLVYLALFTLSHRIRDGGLDPDIEAYTGPLRFTAP
jgi:hypothetical protein